jgi:hypothetical protein
MANNWTIESSKPAKGEKYEWRFPANQQQHVEETTAPGDLAIKPKDISLKPTNPPKKSGVQSGLSDWTIESGAVSDWYVLGEIIQE